jgi:hypothetical protein
MEPLKFDPTKIKHDVSYVGARLREPSTYNGLAILAGLVGFQFDPSLGKALVAIGIAVGGLLGVLLPG